MTPKTDLQPEEGMPVHTPACPPQVLLAQSPPPPPQMPLAWLLPSPQLMLARQFAVQRHVVT